MTNWWRRIAGIRISLSRRSSPDQRPEPPEEQPVAPTLPRWAAQLSNCLSKTLEVIPRLVSDRRWKGPLYFDFRVIGLLIPPLFFLLFLPSPRTRHFEDLIRLTQGLALIIRANRPLPEGLEHMRKDLPRRRLRRLFRVLQSDLEEGSSLPDAMAARPRFFPADYVARVRTGYETGALADTLEAFARDLSFEHERNAYISAKLLYAGLLSLAVVSGVVVVLMLFLPSFVEVLDDFEGTSAPPIETVRFAGSLGAGALAAVFLGVAVLRSRPFSAPGRFFRRLLSRVLRFIPVVGPSLERENLAMASDIMARMLDAGAPLDEALDAAAKAPLDPRHAAVFGRMAERARSGVSLTEAADAEGAVLPRSYRGFVACGERGGQLGEALRQTAAFYRTRNDKVARIAWDVVLPCVVLALGACVLGIVYVIFGVNIALVEALL